MRRHGGQQAQGHVNAARLATAAAAHNRLYLAALPEDDDAEPLPQQQQPQFGQQADTQQLPQQQPLTYDELQDARYRTPSNFWVDHVVAYRRASNGMPDATCFDSAGASRLRPPDTGGLRRTGIGR